MKKKKEEKPKRKGGYFKKKPPTKIGFIIICFMADAVVIKQRLMRMIFSRK